jgi:hypothetical protein
VGICAHGRIVVCGGGSVMGDVPHYNTCHVAVPIVALTNLLCHTQQWLCMLLLIMYGGGWVLGILLCLHGVLEPMIGFHPNRMGP